MKLKPYVEKVGQHGEIIIPDDYLRTLGLYPGEEVELKLTGKRLLVEAVKVAVIDQKKSLKDPVEALTGSIPLNDPKLIDAIVESEEIYG